MAPPWPLALVIVLALAAALSACDRTPKRLDRPMIDALTRASAQAAAAGDADAVCALYTEDAQVRVVEVRFSGSEVQQFAKPQFCAYLRSVYAALSSAPMDIRTSYEVQSVQLAADGQSAEVVAVVTDTLSLAGQAMQQSSEQSATVVLLPGGQARYARVAVRMVR